MNKIISKGLWREVTKMARRAPRRKAAIAYVTRDYLGFKRGDLLVVDASLGAIRAGETRARLLETLLKRGVHIVSCPGLHAKVITFGNAAVVGSANMSDSSANSLVEAACVSDSPALIAAVESFIHQLSEQGTVLSSQALRPLLKIKVVKRGFGRGARGRRVQIEALGNKTWILGVHELRVGAFPKEAAVAASGEARAGKLKTFNTSSIDWIRWSSKGQARRGLKPGDGVTEIWRPLGRKHPTHVYRNSVVLSRQEEEKCSRFYIEKRPNFERDGIRWLAFKRMLRKIGFPRTPGPNSGLLVPEDWAELIQKNWNRI